MVCACACAPRCRLTATRAARLQRYKHLFEVNQKHGSFYLQSKVFRAWEALNEEYTAQGLKTPEEGAEDGSQQPQQQQQQLEDDKQQRRDS